MGKLILYHGTSIENVESIKKSGLRLTFGEVYLTDSLKSAVNWIGIRVLAMKERGLAVIEVEVDEKQLQEGCDHSPLIHDLLGVGKSIVSTKAILPSQIKNIHEYKRK